MRYVGFNGRRNELHPPGKGPWPRAIIGFHFASTLLPLCFHFASTLFRPGGQNTIAVHASPAAHCKLPPSQYYDLRGWLGVKSQLYIYPPSLIHSTACVPNLLPSNSETGHIRPSDKRGTTSLGDHEITAENIPRGHFIHLSFLIVFILYGVYSIIFLLL